MTPLPLVTRMSSRAPARMFRRASFWSVRSAGLYATSNTTPSAMALSTAERLSWKGKRAWAAKSIEMMSVAEGDGEERVRQA